MVLHELPSSKKFMVLLYYGAVWASDWSPLRSRPSGSKAQSKRYGFAQYEMGALARRASGIDEDVLRRIDQT